MADNSAELRELKNIEKELIDIRVNTSSRGSFVRGVLQGAGAIVGSLLTLALLGWILSLVGIIPGLGDLTQYFKDAASHLH